MNKTILIPLVALSVNFAGCETQPTKEQSGAVIGGVLGGLLANEISDSSGSIIAGTLIGAIIGGAVGRSMDDVDRMNTARTLELNRDHQPSSWRNPNSGLQYTTTPTRTYETSSGWCRDYTMEAEIDGRIEEVQGTACRQADGSWPIVS